MAAKRKSKSRPDSNETNETQMPRQVALRRVSKGKRPQFHDSEAVDQLFAVVTSLAAELSVAFDRIDTLERVLVAAGVITDDCVETYQPAGTAAEARSVRREALIERIFAVFEAYGAQRPAAHPHRINGETPR